MRRLFFGLIAALVALAFLPLTSASAVAMQTLNCSLTVPANPTSATGLSTPYVLHGAAGENCTQSDVDHRAFVQANIVAPNGDLSVYGPLTVDAAHPVPAAPPVVPTLPAGAVVALWVGYNGNTLLLDGPGAGDFVNGAPGSPFGQVSYSKTAPDFFAAATGKSKVPPVGTGRDGLPCPTVRSFRIADQDPSDNTTTTYRINAAGQTAQDTAANVGVGARIGNPSDNRLLDVFLDPALGCAPFTAPDLANPGHNSTGQGLNELSAAANQQDPVALVPTNDPMTTVDGQLNKAKTDLYRAGVGQPPTKRAVQGERGFYCGSLQDIAPASIALDAPFTTGSPSPAAGVDLHQFLLDRLAASIELLGCNGPPAVAHGHHHE